MKFIYSEKATECKISTLLLSYVVPVKSTVKIFQNLHLTFVLNSASLKYGEDFAKFCGLLRTYEL